MESDAADRCGPTAPGAVPADAAGRVPPGHATDEAPVVQATEDTLAAEATAVCADLLRMDTSNYGDGSGPGERQAAEYVAELLTDWGHDPLVLESEPRRTTVVVHVPGTDPTRPALVVHGHLDVVPALAEDWRVPPFSGQVVDGALWGRGAVDMKDMDAMVLAVLHDMTRRHWGPARPLVVVFFADEEAGGRKGSHWLVEHHPEIFDGATQAVGEVGGWSVTLDGRRAYLLQTAEKGLAWLRLVARGRAGHGSAVNTDNAVTALAGAVHRVGTHAWPIDLTPTVRSLLRGVAELTGLPWVEPEPGATQMPGLEELLAALGPARRFVGATVSDRANPTVLRAGYKVNVVPERAEAGIDLRFLPHRREAAFATLAELTGPEVGIEIDNEDIGLEVPFAGDLVDAMAAALHRADPTAAVLPYMLSAGTDNKALSTLGIAGYGFVPLRLPPDLDFTGMFHGVDERVPLDALAFGTRVLADFLRAC